MGCMPRGALEAVPVVALAGLCGCLDLWYSCSDASPQSAQNMSKKKLQPVRVRGRIRDEFQCPITQQIFR
jgi:hypothetical protein